MFFPFICGGLSIPLVMLTSSIPGMLLREMLVFHISFAVFLIFAVFTSGVICLPDTLLSNCSDLFLKSQVSHTLFTQNSTGSAVNAR